MSARSPARARLAAAEGGWGRPVVCGRSALVLLGAGAAFLVWPFGPVTAALALGLGALGLLSADLVMAPRPSRLAVARHFPGTLSLGTRAELSWSLRNPLGRPVVVHIADELAPSLSASARRARLRMGPGQSATVRATVTPGRRGRFTPTQLVVRASGPLGLMARQSALLRPSELRVYPSFGSRREADLRIERMRILEVGLRSARARGGATDFEHLRDYTVDDDARRIDWAATARSDRPIVRTYRAERNQRIVCLLDNGRAMAGQVGGVARAEHAIDAIMMLTSVAARVGDMPGLVAFDRDTRAVVPPRGGPLQLGRVTEALYDLHPVLAQSDYRSAFREVLSRFQRRAMLCLLTDLDEALVGALLPSVSLISGTHLLVVGALPDPAVVGWARQVASDLEGTYRSAAAVASLTRRRQLAQALRARGALVVDALPGVFAPRLTDTYLQVKASGRL